MPRSRSASSEPRRLVALGASNLTRGLQTVVAVARSAWPDIEILTALGHGRSYGMRSAFLLRQLPGILDCGLWDRLRERVPTHALVTDVGNDILYGASVEQITTWVGEALRRLRDAGASTIVVTGLPMASIARLDVVRFLAFRTVLVPGCRLSLHDVKTRARAVEDELRTLASRHRGRFVELPGDWYGVDPIHVRRDLWAYAWSHIVLGDREEAPPAIHGAEWLRLYAARPARQWLAGREQRCPQPALHVGTTPISLY